MEVMPGEQGADWAAIAPLIQERQREIAARSAESDHTARTGPVRSDLVRPADSFTGVRHDPKQSGRSPNGAVQTLQVADQSEQPPADVAGSTNAKAGSNASAKALSDEGKADTDEAGEKTASSQNELSDEAQAVVAEMAARDREVRAHEQAHARVGGQYAGQPTYSYQEGPDGNNMQSGVRCRLMSARLQTIQMPRSIRWTW